jgi:hypothetical protein
MVKSNKKITDQDVMNMDRLSSLGYKHKEIAEMLGIHPGTVSKKLTQLRKQRRATEGLLDHSISGASTNAMQSPGNPGNTGIPGNVGITGNTGRVIAVANRSDNSAMAVSVPTNNPFHVLNDFNEIASVVSAGGSVVGSGVSLLYDGFANESLPYEERMQRAMKGGMVVAGSILSAFATFQSLSQLTKNVQSQQQPIMRNGQDGTDDSHGEH